MEEVAKEGERAKEEVRVLTSRVAELEDVNKEVTGRLQQEQAAHEVSTHLQVVVMCMYIQTAKVGILESQCIIVCTSRILYTQRILHTVRTCVKSVLASCLLYNCMLVLLRILI